MINKFGWIVFYTALCLMGVMLLFRSCGNWRAAPYVQKTVASANDQPIDFPRPVNPEYGITVAILTRDGFSTWNEVLSAYTGLEIEMAMFQGEGVSRKVILSLDPVDVGLMQYQRTDGKFDLGWSIYSDLELVRSAKLVFKSGSATVDFPVTLVFGRVR